MSDEANNAGDSGTATAAAGVPQVPADEHTTVPNAPESKTATAPAAAGKWEMPKPKFQQTSGYLPQGYLKAAEPAAGSAPVSPESGNTAVEEAPFVAAAPLPAADGAGPVAPPPAIEPQPDLADQLIPEEPMLDAAAPEAAAATKKGGYSAVAVILGIIGILIFISVFVAAVYYFFFTGRTDGSTF